MRGFAMVIAVVCWRRRIFRVHSLGTSNARRATTKGPAGRVFVHVCVSGVREWAVREWAQSCAGPHASAVCEWVVGVPAFVLADPHDPRGCRRPATCFACLASLIHCLCPQEPLPGASSAVRAAATNVAVLRWREEGTVGERHRGMEGEEEGGIQRAMQRDVCARSCAC